MAAPSREGNINPVYAHGRVLLPAPAPSSASSTTSDEATFSIAKRTPHSVSACEACRKRKSKCDATRPICQLCQQKRTACVYDTREEETRSQASKRKIDDLTDKLYVRDEVLFLLQTGTEAEAQRILAMIRNRVSPENIVRDVRASAALLSLNRP